MREIFNILIKIYYCIFFKNNFCINWYFMFYNGIFNFRMILVISVNKCILLFSKFILMFKNY